MELSYSGTTITTSSGLTLIPGATQCQADRLLIATAVVSGTGVTSVSLVDPHYIQPMKYVFPGQGVTSDGRITTVNITGGGTTTGSGVSQECYRVNYNQALLVPGTTRVSVPTGLTLPANTVVIGSWIKSNTAFAGVANPGVSMGNAVSDTAYSNVYALGLTVAPDYVQAETGLGASTVASSPVLLIFTADAALSGLTAGQVDACILYQELTKVAAPTVL
jgi:hypothetical protein